MLNKKNILRYLTTTVLVVIVTSFLVMYAFGIDEKLVHYIAGKYGSKCYVEGSEHGNIKYPVEFESLDDCLEYINNQ